MSLRGVRRLSIPIRQKNDYHLGKGSNHESAVTLMRATPVSTVTEEIANLLHQKLYMYRISQYLLLNSRNVEDLLGQRQLKYIIIVYSLQRTYTCINTKSPWYCSCGVL